MLSDCCDKGGRCRFGFLKQARLLLLTFFGPCCGRERRLGAGEPQPECVNPMFRHGSAERLQRVEVGLQSALHARAESGRTVLPLEG